MRILAAFVLLAVLAMPTSSAAPLPSTCTSVAGLDDFGFCETSCEGDDGNARSQFNTFFVLFRGVAPCDGSEGYTYAHVILVAAGAAAATGDYGDGRQTAALVFVAGVGLLLDWHEHGGECTTVVGAYDAHGWPYYEHDLGCPVGNAPASPDPGYGSLLP